MANTVPAPELPPRDAVPYRVLLLPATVKPAYGLAPPLLVRTPEKLVLFAPKLYRVLKVCAVTQARRYQAESGDQRGQEE